MSNNINTLQDKLDDLTEDVRNDAELILNQIYIDELLDDPENYIQTLATEFVAQHEDEIKRGILIGRKYAKIIIKETKRADSGQG